MNWEMRAGSWGLIPLTVAAAVSARGTVPPKGTPLLTDRVRVAC